MPRGVRISSLYTGQRGYVHNSRRETYTGKFITQIFWEITHVKEFQALQGKVDLFFDFNFVDEIDRTQAENISSLTFVIDEISHV